MSENCSDCPLLPRVEVLEEELDRCRDRPGEARKEMFERLSAMEQARASSCSM